MIVRYNVIGYLLSEGFHNVMKNKKSTGASLMIMCATMLIFGLFFLIGENVNHMMREIESEQGMQVFMYKDATEEQIQKLQEDIKSLDNVAKVTYISREEALNSYKEKWGENGENGGENVRYSHLQRLSRVHRTVTSLWLKAFKLSERRL